MEINQFEHGLSPPFSVDNFFKKYFWFSSFLINMYLTLNYFQNGWSDVVIIDKGNIADGTSKTGSGMCGLFRPSHERTIVQVSIQWNPIQLGNFLKADRFVKWFCAIVLTNYSGMPKSECPKSGKRWNRDIYLFEQIKFGFRSFGTSLFSSNEKKAAKLDCFIVI